MLAAHMGGRLSTYCVHYLEHENYYTNFSPHDDLVLKCHITQAVATTVKGTDCS